ncbi:hypothetical protein RHMOL_Rhmol10G0014400 [Rhododendron molle]|uniref:Uncharacterized protein n=1 Tax=Rhododendron molle TaxID=49168 RepID=A0ACC0LZ85_RHOML|nr:hypothetical protein RHMOL_Rhmol10G0014400 [Rhododendron molle]
MKEAELKEVPITASPPGSKRLPPCKVPPIRILVPITQSIQQVPKRKRSARKSTENQTQPPPETHAREKRKREVQTQPPSPSLEEQQPKRTRKSPRQIPSKTTSHPSLTYPIRTRATMEKSKHKDNKGEALTYPQKGKRASTRTRTTRTQTQTQTQTNTKNRSNLQLTVTFLQDLSLRGDHLDLLKKTPFWLIIDAIISQKLDADKCIKSDTVLTKLLAAYNPKTDCFTIAGKNVKLTANHVKLIFGISCGTERFVAKLKTRDQVAFAKRHNIQQRLTTKAISDMLKELAQENKTNIEDVQDVARLVCMFLIVKLFFPTSGITVSWKHVDAMEDLTQMKSYNWAAEIRDELIESIKKSQHSPKDVKGCQLIFPVQVAELTETDQEHKLYKMEFPCIQQGGEEGEGEAEGEGEKEGEGEGEEEGEADDEGEEDDEHEDGDDNDDDDDDDDGNGDSDGDNDTADDDDDSPHDDGARTYSLVNARENDDDGDDDNDSDNAAAAADDDSPRDDGAGNYSPVNAEDKDDDNAHAGGHNYLGLEDISQPNQHFQTPQAQNPSQANELEVSKALLHISRNQNPVQRWLSSQDSGSTLVPNTYLPTNAGVFPHLALSPLPAYIHPDQDEPQPNLEFCVPLQCKE